VPYDFQNTQLVDKGIRFTQAEVLPTLSPSHLRRLTFYSDKTILALFDLANEDLAAGQDGATISSETTDALRSAILRLIDAGKKADLSVDQVAEFFGQEVGVRFSGPLPVILQDADGNLAAHTLFRGVSEASITIVAASATSEYLSLLTAESESMNTTADTAEGPELTEEVAEVEQRSPVVQAILDRVKVVDGTRIIVVEKGDTLASFSDAFYKDSLLYRTIYAANTDVLQNPNSLTVGQTLVIPEN